MTTILIVEDEHDTGRVLFDYLLSAGYNPIHVTNLTEAELILKNEKIDLMLLDILLQDGNGLDFAVKLRRNKICVPFIFLTICGHINEIKMGFELGCDDYVQKPVNMDELQLRIKRALRSMNSGLGYYRRIGKFNYNPLIQSLFINDNEIPLGSLESSVLNELSVVNGAIVDKKELLEKYWESQTYYTSRNLDSVIVKLRKRFKPDPTVRILSVKRHGYRLIIN